MDRPVAVQCSADEESPTMKEPVCIFTQPNQVTISLKAVECPGLAGRPGAKATDRQRTNTDKLFADSIYVYTPQRAPPRWPLDPSLSFLASFSPSQCLSLPSHGHNEEMGEGHFDLRRNGKSIFVIQTQRLDKVTSRHDVATLTQVKRRRRKEERKKGRGLKNRTTE